jgi:hypothetical protein
MASIASLVSFSTIAASDNQPWVDMSDPTAIYSNATIGGGTEGVDLSATYGGYLAGIYKHDFTVAAKHNFDFYDVNYRILNSAMNSGVSFDSTWDKDIRVDGVDYDGVNDASVGFFAKLPFLDDRLNFYPKASLGIIWENNIKNTTYVKLDATTRFNFNRTFWVGVTPTYANAFRGVDLNEWTGTLDAGAQISNAFGINMSLNDDKEFAANLEFAF